jgi:hypothetical protein
MRPSASSCENRSHRLQRGEADKPLWLRWTNTLRLVVTCGLHIHRSIPSRCARRAIPALWYPDEFRRNGVNLPGSSVTALGTTRRRAGRAAGCRALGCGDRRFCRSHSRDPMGKHRWADWQRAVSQPVAVFMAHGLAWLRWIPFAAARAGRALQNLSKCQWRRSSVKPSRSPAHWVCGWFPGLRAFLGKSCR